MGHELPVCWPGWEPPPSKGQVEGAAREGLGISPSCSSHCGSRGSSGSSPHGPHGETETESVESTTQGLTVHGCSHPQAPPFQTHYGSASLVCICMSSPTRPFWGAGGPWPVKEHTSDSPCTSRVEITYSCLFRLTGTRTGDF